MQDLIKKTEEKFLPIVSKFLNEIFSPVHLPSHDYLHHLRVWQYAKDFLKESGEKKHDFGNNDIQGIFFACLFHDSGMSVTLDSSHGIESRKIFEKFADEYLLEKIPGYEELLEAIENHDKKEEISLARDNFSYPSRILKVLTLCDDLDAFGAIGVLRYAEIYLMRKISTGTIPSLILENVKHRANFSKKSTFDLPEFKRNHERRINYIIDFYSKAKDQQTSEFDLLNLIQHHVINHRKNYREFLQFLEQDDRYKDLFIHLKSELNITA